MNFLKKYIYLIVLMVGVALISSCQSYFGNVNVNPDAATIATPNTLLPTIETQVTYTYGGDYSRWPSVFSQHVDGFNRQFAAYQQYQFINDDFTTVWANSYSGILEDIQQLKALADAKGYGSYSGIARILEAFTLMMTTDAFGDIPYSQAFKGTDVPQPTFDTQQQIYTTIFQLLTDGVAKFVTPGTIKPAADDIIYGGSIAKWTKFANALTARGYIHLTKVDKTNYQNALNALAKGAFASSADQPGFAFQNSPTAAAPWFQWIRDRDDILTGAHYTALLKSLNDPRISTYGLPLDSTVVFVSAQVVNLMTYSEQKFIEAEALLQTGAAQTAVAAAYTAAIKASFADAQITDSKAITAYLAQPKVTPATLTLNEIITQKYISEYTSEEAWTDWRRTGIPNLTPNSGSAIPRRFLYPLSELNYNSNTPKAGAGLYDRVWWDK